MDKNRVINNTLWIVGIRIARALLVLIITLLTARFLGPSNFGTINYASSVVAFVAPIVYLGFNSILVQELVSNPEQEGEVIGTALALSFCSSLACIGGVIAFVAIANHGETETILVCACYSVLLLFQGMEMLEYWFQAKLLSKYSATVSLLAYFLASAYKIFLLASKKSVYWFAFSSAIETTLLGLGLFAVYKKLGGRKLSFSSKTAQRLFSKGRYYIISNMMVTIFSQTDKIMLKLMVDDTATGLYSAASTCAVMASFIFSAIIDSFRPKIFSDKNTDQQLYERDLCVLYSIVIYMSLVQCVATSLFPKTIIGILYGSEYLPASDVLCLIVWYTTFSYIGTVRNIWILSEGKQQYLWVINLCGALLNVLLNYILIPVSGMMGAALASLLTQAFSNVILGFIIKPIRHNNTLMFRSLQPRYAVFAVKSILRRKSVREK